MGHEDQFAPPGLSGRSAFSEGTFAGTCGNAKDAPIADRGGLKRGRQQSTPQRSFASVDSNAGLARKPSLAVRRRFD
jgi:hypothetical protein